MDRKCAALPKQAYYQKNGPSAKSIWYEFRPMGVGVTVATPGAVFLVLEIKPNFL